MNDSTSSDSGSHPLSNAELRSAVKSVLRILMREGQKKLGTVLDDGRTSLSLRALKRDRQKMYEKLGREVVRLVEADEIGHPGVLTGVERIKKLEAEIEQHAQFSAEKNIDEPEEIE